MFQIFIDPLSQASATAKSDHYYFTQILSVLQEEIMFTIGQPWGLAKWITDVWPLSCLVTAFL